MREIIFYQTDFGDEPVEDFLTQLDSAPRAKVVRNLELLRTQQFVPTKFWKKLHGRKISGKCGWNTRATFIEFWPALTKATG